MTLIFSRGHKFITKQNLLASFSCRLFSSTGLKLKCVEVIQVDHPDITVELDFLNQGKYVLFYRLYKKNNNNVSVL